MNKDFHTDSWGRELGKSNRMELTEEFEHLDKDFEPIKSPQEVYVKAVKTIKELKTPDYKYNEKEILEEVLEYINGTYSQHYVHESANVETGQLILADKERGLGFCIGNVIKYADRFGKKNGHNRKDLLKVIHYAVMALSIEI